ncbi:MAG: thiamine phosphate synthase [Bacteroidetes bacterium]|nr:thiamine phosphate synthase [Bacteroidota bacterium]
MRLIIISSPHFVEKEQEIISSLFKNGLKIFHVRKPGFSKKEMEDYIREIPPDYYSSIIIHSHYSLANKYKLKGIHFPTRFRKSYLKTWFTLKSFRHRSPSYTISASFHRISELLSARLKYDYVFISPVFQSISKTNYSPAFKEKDLLAALNRSVYDIIALGGINHDSAGKALAMGFRGVACMGAIWKSEEPVKEFIRIRDRFDQVMTRQITDCDPSPSRPLDTPVSLT